MAKAIVQFPKGFLWGTATAAHQVEGNNTNNNWSVWEKEPDRIKHGQTAGLACDWWGGRWKEDLDRAAETGQNAHRFSVEWSRIQPEPGQWDENVIERYRTILRGMHDRNLRPMVTLHHFTDPLWLVEMGGWENTETPAYFAKYVEKVVESLKEYVTEWVTINEPNVYSYSGYVSGDFPPGKKDMGTAFNVMVNLVKGHALAYHVIHKVQPEAKVGLAINYRSFYPATKSPLDKFVAKTQSAIFNDLFPKAAVDGKVRFLFKTIDIPEAKNTQDFIGLNYYTRDMVSFDITKPNSLFGRSFYRPDAELSSTGFIANEPDGFTEAIKWSNRFGYPIYITENGVEDEKDTLRPKYLAYHIHKLWHMVNFNSNIKGYYHWSLVDNFEWERGWTQRFGLWGLDTVTQQRIRRGSVDLYAEICRQNGLSSDMIEKYCPDSIQNIFPD